MDKPLKVAIVHDYLHEYGGAEAVVQAIYEIYPTATIYSATYDKSKMDKAGAFIGANVKYPKWKDNFNGKSLRFLHKLFVANLPFYFVCLDLSDYDLILSSTAHFAKGLITNHKKQLHICYNHTIPRFLYGLPGEIRKRDLWYMKFIFWPLDTFLRIIDQIFAKFPDYMLCNSEEVKNRLKKYYKRDAYVINPFAEVATDGIKTIDGDYFVVVGRLVNFKHVDLIINTCGKNNIKLKVIGTGSSESYLKSLASKYKSVEMIGFATQEQKYKLIADSKGMITATEKEDFGMVVVEANAFGKPVIAYKDAGFLETVNDGHTGIFFDTQSEESLLNAINRFDNMHFDVDFIKNHAKKYSKDRFKAEYKKIVDEKVSEWFR